MQGFTKISALIMVLLSLHAHGKARRPLPLLGDSTPKEYKAKARKNYFWAFDVGTLARFQNTPGSLLGFGLGFGLKANVDIRLGTRFHLVPHLGYFFQREGEASASFTHHSLLAGAQGLMDLNQRGRTIYRVGVESSLFTTWSYLSINGQGSFNPLSYDAFFGPKFQIGTAWRDSGNELQFNFSPAYSLSRAFSFFLSVGLQFSSR